jgi:type II secretory pathway pseudopilin PulG
MKWYRASVFLADKYAVLGQPIYLLIVIIIVATIIGIFAVSLQQVMNDTQINRIEQELNRITTEATTMFEYADEGTSIVLHIEFPSSLRYLVFGSLPINTTTEPSVLTLNDTTSNNYYFVMNDGTVRSYHSNARFSNKKFTEIIVLHAGVYDLTLEVCSHEGKTYVTID